VKGKKIIILRLSSGIFNAISIIIVLFFAKAIPVNGQNLSTGINDANLYGIHEITLTGTWLPRVSKRFSTFPNVRFENGNTTIDVKAFYDGDGSGEKGKLWKARLYVTKKGPWSWKVTDQGGIRMKGSSGGIFNALDRNPELKGKLRKHSGNANRWATDRDTNTAFLAFGDTQYTLMDKVWRSYPDSSKGGAGDWDAVIDDSYEKGTTLIRAGAFGGYSVWNGTATVGPMEYPRPNWPWADMAADGDKDVYDLGQLLATETRLMYAINQYEDLYFELIISPKTKNWGARWKDESEGCTATQIENYRKYMVARLSAFPNVIFQLVYDIDFHDTGGGCGANPKGYGDENYAFAQNWLQWLRANDPFNTMRGIGNGNDYDDPFTEDYYNQLNPPPTYLHDEAIGDIGGKTADKYYGIKNTPIFHGEDNYELDDGWEAGTGPSDNNPEYYYRRIFWADLLSGAYPCYGGAIKAIVPYNNAFQNVTYYSPTGTYNTKLRGLDDVNHIKYFFTENKLDIADFHPADSLIKNGPSFPSQVQVAHNTMEDKYIIYHPNATQGEADYDPNDLCENYRDELATHFSCSISSETPTVTLRLYSGKKYITKWFDPSTGIYYKQNDVVGRDENYTFTAPPSLKGKDVILYLEGEGSAKRLAIIGHRGGKYWAPENTLAAFKKCADNNLDWETDLNLTADGEIILMHDMTLDRTTDAELVFGGSNISVNSKTLAQIKTLDAGSHFSSEYAGEKVPTLDEFLDFFVAVAPKNTIISMDTKLDKLSPGTEVYQQIINKIAARDLFDRVFIEVFEVDRVNNTRKLNNGDKLRYAIWVNRKLGLLDEAIASGCFSRIHSSYKIAFRVDDVHAGGIPYFSSHRIESPAAWDAVKNFSIDGVSTDKPDVALWVMRNEIPMCSIKNPVNGATFSKGVTITIQADVGDTDSSITKVEFYSNGSLIGEDATSPYSYSWTNVTEGRYTLTAKVFDKGMSKVATPIYINVK